MEHIHDYQNGVCTICSQVEKVYKKSESMQSSVTQDKHVHEHSHEGHGHTQSGSISIARLFAPSVISIGGLLLALALDHFIAPDWFKGWLRLAVYLVAYIPVGAPVIRDALTAIGRGNFFSEFFLMSIATLGAFALGEYPEAVAVMLFYSIGEGCQTLAVSKAKANIKALLDQRPDQATVVREGQAQRVDAKAVRIGDIIELKPGEKLALDGVLHNDHASFDTAALTGESKPDSKNRGDTVLAGMINLHTLSQVEVTTAYADSKLSKILELVQHATTQKAPTELFISKFAKVYTPIVVFLAIGITFIPYLFVDNYLFSEWLYRALVFFVISCPCALVISIPLGYFGGIGAASKQGVLVKGGNFLDTLAAVRHVVMDKTGTLTEGVFKVQEILFKDGVDQTKMMGYVGLIESKSSHPIAMAIRDYLGEMDQTAVLSDMEEIAGLGMKALVDGKELLVGNFKLLDRFKIAYDVDLSSLVFTTVAVAYDGRFVGYMTIADRIKEGAKTAIANLHRLNIGTTMLSGDKSTVVQHVAEELQIGQAYGDLLPEDKVLKMKEINIDSGSVAFVGDGVNDAPVMALSDVGIAMGGLGSDATIEAADVVIQDDKPGKILTAIEIGKKTKRVVWQNIGFAFGVKAIVLILGAGGLATMWEAVFADVGVALLAILNAVRIQRG